MRRLLATAAVLAVVGGACTSSTAEPVASLTEQLEETSTIINESVGELFELLGMRIEDRSQLNSRIVDLRLPTTIAIEIDKAQRIVPAPGAEAELERYIGFLGELLSASESLDAAVAAEDPVAIALAAVTMEVASGALAVTLPSSSCTILVPEITRDLCDRSGADDYEQDLDFEIRRFVASFRPAFRIPGGFGDVIRARALGSLQGDATLVLQNTATRLDALEPGPAHQRLHAILVDYFPTAAEAWASFEASASGSDPLLYSFLTGRLEVIRVDTLRQLQDEYAIVLAADADSQIVDILSTWFDPPAPADSG